MVLPTPVMTHQTYISTFLPLLSHSQICQMVQSARKTTDRHLMFLFLFKQYLFSSISYNDTYSESWKIVQHEYNRVQSVK